MTTSHIGSFRINGKFYSHNLHFRDDDRVECIDPDGNVILTYTSSSYVIKGNKGCEVLGSLRTKDGVWVFCQEGKPNYYLGKNLLESEIEFSKLYIKGEL